MGRTVKFAGAVSDRLLAVGAWCQVHKRGYSANHSVTVPGLGTRIEANVCPDCAAEREWVLKARDALDAEGVAITAPVLLARAEKLAGHTLLKYLRHDF